MFSVLLSYLNDPACVPHLLLQSSTNPTQTKTDSVGVTESVLFLITIGLFCAVHTIWSGSNLGRFCYVDTRPYSTGNKPPSLILICLLYHSMYFVSSEMKYSADNYSAVDLFDCIRLIDGHPCISHVNYSRIKFLISSSLFGHLNRPFSTTLYKSMNPSSSQYNTFRWFRMRPQNRNRLSE